MSEIEKIILTAARAIVKHYDTQPVANTNSAPRTPQGTQNHSVKTSNGIPVCPRHDKVMREGQYGYFCTTKEEDPEFSNKSGYCNHKSKG